MAKKAKLTATLPNGEIITRTTSRTYSHAVVALVDADLAIAFATSKDWEKTERHNYKYYTECAAGTHEHVAVYGAEGQAEYRRSWAKKRQAESADFIAKFPTADEYCAAQRAARIAAVEARIGKWEELGWAGRGDLAAKLVAKGHYLAREVRAIPVNP